MTLAEFKAWFEGYSEGIEAAPTAKQWKRIKSRVAEINGHAVTERVYVDRYWPSPRTYWSTADCVSNVQYGVSNTTATAQPFNSTMAMNVLGVADAARDSEQ